MADVRAFKGLRFDPARVALSRVLCPPYDVIGREEARRLRKGAVNSIHVELPEGEGSAKYRNAARAWRKWRARLLVEDPPSIYVCEQGFELAGRRLRRLGFLAAMGVSPSAAKAVLRHERTLPKPKVDRLRLLKAVRANVSPIFALFPDLSGAVRRILVQAASRRPDASGRALDVRYRLWRVSDSKALGVIRRALASQNVLIADGHHRYEVARAFYGYTLSPGAGTILTYLCPEEDQGLVVLPTHRVAVWPGLVEEARRFCRISGCPSRRVLLGRLARSPNPYAFGLYAGDFFLAEPLRRDGCRSGLSVEWVECRLLARLPRESVSYTHDPEEAVALARGLGGTAVFVKPFRVAQIRRAVGKVGLLPPKSTYFYPKVPAGLVFKAV